MPKNKDLKRLARQRMAKTGESYTTARAQLLAKQGQPAGRLSEAELAELAGVSTQAVERATGHDWSWWLGQLDAAGCRTEEHREISRLVADRYDVSDWWTQTVVVGYERIVGLREIGQRREGTYDANKSKTFAVPVAVLYRAFADDASRRQWLPALPWSVRTATEPRSIRVDAPEGGAVSFWFTAKGDDRSSVQVQHQKLASRDEVERVKQDWSDRLGALGRWLADSA